MELIFVLPLLKGDAAVQSLTTDASEALGLWRRKVRRDLKKEFRNIKDCHGIKKYQRRIRAH